MMAAAIRPIEAHRARRSASPESTPLSPEAPTRAPTSDLIQDSDLRRENRLAKNTCSFGTASVRQAHVRRFRRLRSFSVGHATFRVITGRREKKDYGFKLQYGIRVIFLIASRKITPCSGKTSPSSDEYMMLSRNWSSRPAGILGTG